MRDIIQVNYKVTSNLREANAWLRELSEYPVIACDFEVAIKYTKQELEYFQQVVDDDSSDWIDKVTYESKLKATALDHPSHCRVTHFQAAWSETDSYVFVITNNAMLNRIMTFLTTTTVKQVWHNASYDFRHIRYHTKKIPIDFEDSQILAKTLLNHVNVHKAKVGLKELAGEWYGSWGIASDMFTVDNILDEALLKYAAIDPCATYKLWTYFNEECELLDKQLKDSYDSTTNDISLNE